jgi:hypothetical protein
MSCMWGRCGVVGLVLFSGLGAGQSDSLADLAAPPPRSAARKAPEPPPRPAAPVLTGPSYPIKLVRPAKVGDRYNYVADGLALLSMTANVSGRTVTISPRNLSVHLDAVEEILALSDTGEASKVTYTVRRCVRREDRHESQLVQPGRVLTATAGKWATTIDIEGANISIEDELVLRGVILLPRLKGITDDDCYGTAGPQQVGAAWAVNSDAVAKLISRERVRVKRQDVTGTVKLTALKDVDGVPHLLINGKALIKQWTPEPADLPKEARFVSGSDEVKFTKLIPVDPSGHCLTDSYSEKALMKLKTSDETIGPDILVDGKLLKTVGIKRTPLEAAPIASGAE